MTASIPETWRAALAAVQKAAPSACIVGGCLRDLVMGGEIKDIDIFIPYSEADSLSVAGAIASSGLGLGWKNSLVTADYQTGMRGEVRLVEEYSSAEIGLPVQLIYLNDRETGNFAEECWERVDFDACQITHDGVTLFTSDDAMAAYSSDHWVLLKAEDEAQFRRSLRRVERFKAKYPHVTFDLSIGAPFQINEAA